MRKIAKSAYFKMGWSEEKDQYFLTCWGGYGRSLATHAVLVIRGEENENRVFVLFIDGDI